MKNKKLPILLGVIMICAMVAYISFFNTSEKSVDPQIPEQEFKENVVDQPQEKLYDVESEKRLVPKIENKKVEKTKIPVSITTIDITKKSNRIPNINLTKMNDIDGGWSVGGACANSNVMNSYVIGDWKLTGDTTIRNAKVIVYGKLIDNGYSLNYECPNSELVFQEISSKITSKDCKIYPNKIREDFYVEGNDLESLELYDLSGKKAFKSELKNGVNKILVPNLYLGNYLIKIFKNDGNEITRVIRIG